MGRVIVIGGGAAGMISAIFSASNGNDVTILEKNEKLGKKLYITGKGRCNLSNNVESDEFLKNVCRNSKFLFSSIYGFTPYDTIEFFTNLGLKLKTERGNRVFPESDKASDVTKVLQKTLNDYGVEIKLNEKVIKITKKEDKIHSVITEQEEYICDSVILATGGVSYPLTGSTGDGYKFSKEFGHTITELKPGLSAIETFDVDKDLQGLSLKNVAVSVKENGKEIFNDFGEMLFTHFGISGPIILTCSSIINRKNIQNLDFSIDFKPALSCEMINSRLLREFKDNNKRSIAYVLRGFLPKNLVKPFLDKIGITESVNCSEITTEIRDKIIKTLKGFKLKLKKLRPIEEAIITSGGISVDEINPKTMESKFVKNLFFAGEIIDVDAFTGGFNIQIAFSTGYLAGINS